jgi:radical SAM superfamily enzyme YgiQ (UPF0313 family)
MHKRHKIVLYNPHAVFYTMPLGMLAIGSRLDPDRFEVRIIDARLERDPLSATLAELDDALCLGVSVLTGAPIRDALAISRAVRARQPNLPIVWGGWHPSLFPRECLDEASINVSVIGQGEDTFAEIVERFAAGATLDGIEGSAHRREQDIVIEPPRALRDLNAFPAHNYDLIDVEKYFALKKARQLDYISSQGCRFRCTFCADPHVYKRGWFGLEPRRMADEMEFLWKKYDARDVNFQDETFFTSRSRVETIADEFLHRDLKFTWTATMRADQGDQLDDALLAKCKRAGLRRVMIGVESGSQQMLDWMKKDIRVAQVFSSAEKCLRHDIAILFNFIVGFPDEPMESVIETMNLAKALRASSPHFEIAVFYFKPYPGNDIAELLLRQGYPFPRTLEEWAEFDYVGSSSPSVTREKYNLIERFKFYQRIAWSRPTLVRAPLQALARWRCTRDWYAFPFEKVITESIRHPVRLS